MFLRDVSSERCPAIYSQQRETSATSARHLQQNRRATPESKIDARHSATRDARAHEPPPFVSCLPLAACLSLGALRGGGGVPHGLESHHQLRSNRARHRALGRRRSSRAPSAIITGSSALATTVPRACRVSSQPGHRSTIRCPLALGPACAGLQRRPGGRQQHVEAIPSLSLSTERHSPPLSLAGLAWFGWLWGGAPYSGGAAVPLRGC